jgi:lysophospholipase L1-like esterase
MSVSIAFVGDGLTAHGRWEEWFPEYEVHNLGVSGDTTDEVIARLDSVVELNPDAVVLLAGTNDIGWRRSDEYIVRNLETMLYDLHKRLPETRILVQSVTPREREYADTIRSVNRHLWQFAPTQRALYLDLWPALADEDGEISARNSDDRLRLTPAGYEAWLGELRPAIDELFSRPPATSSIPIQNV